MLDDPHVFLDEVMRQAAESEIIRLTMDIRDMTKPINYYKGNEVRIIPEKEFVDGCYTWADQVITATNGKRREANNYIRQMLGYSGSPQDGEKIICLKNYWDDCSSNGDPLVNGATGILRNPKEITEYIPFYIKTSCPREFQVINCDFELGENSLLQNVKIDKNLIMGKSPALDWRTSYALRRMSNKIGDITPREFDFGYAITGHKSQGSQYKNVLVLEESFPFDTIEHARWLYTTCTRAEEKLILVR